jgi:hypothetical protein
MSRWMTVAGLGWRLAGAAIIALVIVYNVPQAIADAAAGSAAFERADYARAMAEWATAAERGDPDAEFGLGMLHELGAGGLKQDYKEADRWYQKAAEHDHVGALNRLALDWSAGSDDLPADLVEAYKWILLASEKGLATWKEAHAAKKAEPPPTVAPAPASAGTAGPAIPPPRAFGAAPAAAGKPGGCPGWPFPTLPCTEQFPALGGAPAQRAPAIPSPRPPPAK